jgi:hypothetical protein
VRPPDREGIDTTPAIEDHDMAESMVRGALKQGLKLWIVASERVRVRATELREDLEDVVVEAREEYEQKSDPGARTDAERSNAVTGADLGVAAGAGVGAAVGSPLGAAVGGAVGAGAAGTREREKKQGTVAGAAAGGAVGAAAGGSVGAAAGAALGGAVGAGAGDAREETGKKARTPRRSSSPKSAD